MIDLYFFKWLWVTLYSFLSFQTWRTSFSTSCRACLVVTNSLSFYLYGNFNFSLIFDIIEHRYRILCWHFSSFSTLNISTHCLQASKVSNEKSADSKDFFYVRNSFSLAVFRFSVTWLWLWCVIVQVSEFILLGVELLGCVDLCPSLNLGLFQQLFLPVFSLPPSLSLLLLRFLLGVC